ncbi:hypothetical protein [Rufibacter aurantiacus]|uniref:hypothetical protein n=1 Tax=Rufibacter aurantiacus TaxID=2817374 RepID=UPI001B311F2E|nr:hypothetical protein [Rufibacter aurantiacus]
MGAWGISISSNDTYADIYSAFFDLYHSGQEVPGISEALVSGNSEIINDEDDSNNFWFALAKAQWECKQLDSGVLARVKQIVESGSDLEIWQKLDADARDIKKRKMVLDKFLSDLQIERPKAKTRKKKINRQPVFIKGDCITFKLANGNFGGAVVLESDYKTGYGHNLIATTRINQKTKPIKEEFESAEVMVINFAKWEDTASIRWIFPVKFKAISHLFEKVDSIQVDICYDLSATKYGFSGDLVGNLVELTDRQFESELMKPASAGQRQTIKELTRKNLQKAH